MPLRFDPLFDPLSSAPLRRPLAPIDYVQDDEEEALIRRAGRGLLGGLAWVGETLDKPGRAVRGTLSGLTGGDWGGGLLNLVPFSDSLGITSPDTSVGGRRLLEDWGMLSKNRPGLDVGDVVGFGAELLLDPLSYATLGAKAVGKAGQVADALGLMPKAAYGAGGALERGARLGRLTSTLGDVITAAGPEATSAAESMAAARGWRMADLINEPLGGLARVRLPFTDIGATLGTGPTAQRVAVAMDSLGDAIRYGDLPGTSFSPGRALAAALSPRTKGAYSRAGQVAASQLYDAEAAARHEGLSEGFRAMSRLDDLEVEGDRLARMLRFAVEPASPGVAPGRFAQQYASDLATLPADYQQEFQSVVDDMIRSKDTLYRQMGDAGLYTPELLDSTVEHFPSQLEGAWTAGRDRSRIFDTGFWGTRARKDLFRNIPERLSTLDAMGSDPLLMGAGRLPVDQAAAHIENTYRVGDTGQAKGLARWFGARPDDLIDTPVFQNPVDAFTSYQVAGRQALADAEGLKSFLAQNAEPIDPGRTDLVPIKDVLTKTRFAGPGSDVSTAMGSLGQMLGVSADDVGQMGVRSDIAADATRFLKLATEPDALKPLTELHNSFLNLWKAGVTSPFPAFHGRNFLGGQIQNWISGAWDPKDVRDVDGLLRQSKPITGLETAPAIARVLDERGLERSAENATRVLQEMAFSQELIGRHQGLAGERAGDMLDDFEGMIPGKQPFSIRDSLRGALPRYSEEWKPWNVRGVFGAQRTSFAPVRTGEEMGWYVESLNRVSPFVTMLKQGADPAVAAAKIKAAQVDYSSRAFSDFERSTLKRLFPFYSFSSRQLAHVVDTLATEPGGRMAQTIRASSQARENDPLMPEHVSKGLSIPLGELEDGSRRYLTGFGLMHEDPLGLLQVRSSPFGTAQATGMELLSRINPLGKAAIEVGMGRQLFAQGRELRDADPTIGRLIANVTGADEPASLPPSLEYGVSLVPFLGRTASTARMMTDPRKDLPETLTGLLTGIRVTDVSPRAQEAQLRTLLQETLRDEFGAKAFSRAFVPDETIAGLAPAEQAEAMRLEAILNRLNQAGARRRREERKLRPLPF